MPSILNDIEVQAMKINPKEYDYPFENLVFEGGGNKGLAYCGAVKVNTCILYMKNNQTYCRFVSDLAKHGIRKLHVTNRIKFLSDISQFRPGKILLFYSTTNWLLQLCSRGQFHSIFNFLDFFSLRNIYDVSFI